MKWKENDACCSRFFFSFTNVNLSVEGRKDFVCITMFPNVFSDFAIKIITKGIFLCVFPFSPSVALSPMLSS